MFMKFFKKQHKDFFSNSPINKNENLICIDEETKKKLSIKMLKMYMSGMPYHLRKDDFPNEDAIYTKNVEQELSNILKEVNIEGAVTFKEIPFYCIDLPREELIDLINYTRFRIDNKSIFYMTFKIYLNDQLLVTI